MANNNSLPYEIIAAPFTVWFAPVGTAFPDVEETPPSPWAKVGSSGDLNYMDDGVTVSHRQTMELFRALGDAGSRKASRPEEDLLIKLNLADLTLEQYKHPCLIGDTGFQAQIVKKREARTFPSSPDAREPIKRGKASAP